MTTKNNKSRVLLIIACVLSFVLLAASAMSALTIGLNINGATDALAKVLMNSGYAATEVDGEITMMMFTFILEVFIELYFGLFYYKAIKFKANSVSFARRLMSKAIWHFIVGAFLPAIFAMIAANRMSKQGVTARPVEVKAAFKEDEAGVPDYKLTAMSEAIARLKELKDKGAISEEEYYINLNRILEG